MQVPADVYKRYVRRHGLVPTACFVEGLNGPSGAKYCLFRCQQKMTELTRQRKELDHKMNLWKRRMDAVCALIQKKDWNLDWDNDDDLTDPEEIERERRQNPKRFRKRKEQKPSRHPPAMTTAWSEIPNPSMAHSSAKRVTEISLDEEVEMELEKLQRDLLNESDQDTEDGSSSVESTLEKEMKADLDTFEKEVLDPLDPGENSSSEDLPHPSHHEAVAEAWNESLVAPSVTTLISAFPTPMITPMIIPIPLLNDKDLPLVTPLGPESGTGNLPEQNQNPPILGSDTEL